MSAEPEVDLVWSTAALLDAAIGDAPELARLLDATIAEGWAVFPEALPVVRARVEDFGGREWGTRFFVATIEGRRVLAGFGGYKGAPSFEGRVEIGYAVAPSLRGRGVATAAARGLVRDAFAAPRVTAVDAHTLARDETNANASRRVLEKLGFAKIGELDDPDEGRIWRFRRARGGRG